MSASYACATIGSSRASAFAIRNRSSMNGCNRAMNPEPVSEVPRAKKYHAPSPSLRMPARRSRWIRACVSSRSTAFAFKHSSRNSPSDFFSAPMSNLSSASGATVAAETIASAFDADNVPARIAAAVFGRSRTFFDVSRELFAAWIDDPEIAASCSAADRYPALFQVPAASTRRASSVFAEAATRSNRSRSRHNPSASHNGTASGSRRARC